MWPKTYHMTTVHVCYFPVVFHSFVTPSSEYLQTSHEEEKVFKCRYKSQ